MTTSILNDDSTDFARTLPGIAVQVQRSAFYIDGSGGSVFTWLHQSAEQRSLDHGVIICPPIGYEQIHAHRGLRHLADALAAVRIPTIRFDWHGTGDSPGNDEDPGRVRAWLSNLRQTIEWMRQQLGCRKISLVGLRVGATLATLATLENEIDGVVLWSPVIKGRSYVREMKVLSLTSDAPRRESCLDSAAIEAAGFVLCPETAGELSAIDLTKVFPHGRRVLVVSRGQLAEDERLCQQWSTIGIQCQNVTAEGYAEMMVEPHRNQIPDDAIRQITDWLKDGLTDSSQELPSDRTARAASSALIPADVKTVNSNQLYQSVRESTLSISRVPHLFGIVSEPLAGVAANLPTIVLLNAGSVHHVGPNRLNVFIARRLASLGFRCLRIDLNGLGDSVADSINRENDSYTSTAFRDIEITLKTIQQQYRGSPVVMMGLCSGAYAAFQSAAQISDPAFVEAILINPLTFFWKDGMTIDNSPTKHLRSFHYYQSVLRDPVKWIKLLSGKSNIGITGAAILLARRLKLINASNNVTTGIVSQSRDTQSVSHPQQEDLPGDLARIIGRGRKLAMFFSNTDPGFGILNFHAKKQVGRLRESGQLKIDFINDADHTFTVSGARLELMDAICKHLLRRYQITSAD